MNKLIYICSPFRGDYETNTKNAIRYSAAAFAAGYIPVTPHIYFPQFMNDWNPEEREKAMQAGEQLLLQCSEVWVFGLDHPSDGMSSEIALARKNGIPIRDGFAEITKQKAYVTKQYHNSGRSKKHKSCAPYVCFRPFDHSLFLNSEVRNAVLPHRFVGVEILENGDFILHPTDDETQYKVSIRSGQSKISGNRFAKNYKEGVHIPATITENGLVYCRANEGGAT